MNQTYPERAAEPQRRMATAGIDVALLTDPGSVYSLWGGFDYLGVEFGRPTMVVVPRGEAPVLITPLMESEVALAVIGGGTRKAAAFLSEDGPDRFVSPTVHNLQVLQSGHDPCMVRPRSTLRRLGRGDPVNLCFGGIAEEVHAAAEDVYRRSGPGASYRTGRGIGYPFLESPQLKLGDRTALEAGMTFAVDGGVTVPGRFGTRVGDSVVVTDEGFEYLTPYPKGLRVL